MPTLPRFNLFTVAAYITLAAITGLVYTWYPADDARRWWALGLMIVFNVVVIGLPPTPAKAWQVHLHLAVLTVLVTILIVLGGQTFAPVVLFFVLSTIASENLPSRTSIPWLIGFGVLTAIMYLLEIDNIPFALLIALGSFGGYFYIGAATNAQQQAERAQHESQALLGELQTAHLQLQEQALRSEELAIAQERNRLAREMHDTLGHRLTVAAVQLEGAQRLIARDPDKAGRMVGTVREQVIEGLAELRHTVATLRIPLEADLALPTALSQLATNFQQATGIVLHVALPKTIGEISPEHHHALYRAAQEMLTNVQRHAQAKQAWLRLDQTEPVEDASGRMAAMVQVSVEDDGRGFPADQAADQASLRGLRERAQQLHGELLINPGGQGGSCVTMRLPLPNRETITSTRPDGF